MPGRSAVACAKGVCASHGRPPARLRNEYQPTTKASLGPPCDVWPQDAYPPTIHRRRSNSCARMSACRLGVHTTMELWAEALWATCAGSKRRQPIRLDPSRLPPVSDRKLEICGSAVEQCDMGMETCPVETLHRYTAGHAPGGQN